MGHDCPIVYLSVSAIPIVIGGRALAQSNNPFGQLLEGWKMTSIVSISGAGPWGVASSRGNDPAGIAELQNTWNFYGNTSDFSGLKRDSVPYFAPSASG